MVPGSKRPWSMSLVLPLHSPLLLGGRDLDFEPAPEPDLVPPAGLDPGYL